MGLGLDRHAIEEHPDTGAPLIGTGVPHWEDLVEMVLGAAKVIEGIDMQAWHVTICDDGPVLMEVNISGDYNLPQLAHGQGMWTPDFITFLAQAAHRRDKERPFNPLRLRETN